MKKNKNIAAKWIILVWLSLVGKMGEKSEIIHNEVFKWNISILCSTKRLTADITMIIFHRHHFSVYIYLFSLSTVQRKCDGFFFSSAGCDVVLSLVQLCVFALPKILPLQFRYDYYYNSRRPCIWTHRHSKCINIVGKCLKQFLFFVRMCVNVNRRRFCFVRFKREGVVRSHYKQLY